VVDVSAAAPFTHIGLLYHSEPRYLTATAGFVRGALAAGHPTLVAVPGKKLDLIREHLGDDAERVTFADMAVAGRNPGRIIPTVLLDFAGRHADRRVAIIGEPIWPGRSDDEYPACALHEALINNAFAGRDAAILCPYDATNLDATALADALVTHPLIAEGGDLRKSRDYTIEGHAGFNRPLPPPPAGAEALSFAGPADLSAVRARVRAHATSAGLPGERVDDLVVAISELAANAVEHGAGTGALTMWAPPGAVVCQVDDAGHLGDPLAGRVPPSPLTPRGRGLVVVNLLCDLVRVHSEPGRTAVRVFVNRR
jgi:anti-sigma regulatory factor (Ser/Thr protein kinase)